MSFETKYIGGVVTEVKETERAGVKVGITEGYMATWDIDRGNGIFKDKFVKGCFRESIADLLKRDRRVRYKDHHGRTIGGFPIESVRENDIGLFGVGEINLGVGQGTDLYSLVLNKDITDFSIGFSVDEYTMEGDLRIITKATIWECSAVDEPMNPHANIIDVKNLFQDLPLAGKDHEWDEEKALARVAEHTKSEEAPTAEYSKAFLSYDKDAADEFKSYQLPIADVVDGKLCVIQSAVIAAAETVKADKEMPEEKRSVVIQHLDRYFAKMSMPSPFEDEEKQYYISDDVKTMDVREIESVLKGTGVFSKKAANILATRIKPKAKIDEPEETDNTKQNILDEIKAMTGRLSA